MYKGRLLGRVFKKNELRQLSNSQNIKFTMSTSEKVKGEWKSYYFDVTAWGKLAELVDNHFHQGDPILLDTNITTGSYEKDGNTVYTINHTMTGFEFLPTKGKVGDLNPLKKTRKDSDEYQEDDIPF